MAKRKKAHHTTKRRTRRRMGAVPGKNDLEEVLGLVLASVGGTIIQRMIPATVSPKIVALGQMGIGWYMKGKPSPLMRGVGYGLLGTGAISMTHDLGIIHGVEDLVSGVFNGGGGQYLQLPVRRIEGLGNDNRVNGLGNDSRVNGADEPQMMENRSGMPDYFAPIGM